LLARYAPTDGGILEDRVPFPDATNVQTTLVILKPDNFYRPSRRPGNIVDVFSRTGLNIVAAKLFSFTASMGEQFYGQLRGFFREKLRPVVAGALKKRLEGAFDFAIGDAVFDQMAGLLAADNAETEFNKIVQYMSGIPGGTHCPPEKRDVPGPNRCLALLYRGQDAVEEIRRWLGSTNPDKADAGTVRSDFGRDLMRNAAHASDSAGNAERERKIIGLWKEDPQIPSDFQRTIESHLG
jgi:nucleoside diphosphate kinase